jgi:drug/metabolite transporter (DMT)-like permease
MAVWGASPTLVRIANGAIDPLLVGLYRTILGGLVALPAMLAMRQGLPTARAERRLLAISSLSGFVVFPLLFGLGQQRTSALHGGMILAALPIITGTYAALLARRRPPLRWFVGGGVALAGEVAIVALRAGAGTGHPTLLGDLVIAASALIVSAGYVAGARLASAGYPSVATTFWGVAVGAIVCLPILAVVLLTHPTARWHAASWGAVAFLAIPTTLVAYVGWYWALARGGIARISTIQFFQPFSGIVLATVLIGERVTPALVIAAAAILVGVTVAQRGPRRA